MANSSSLTKGSTVEVRCEEVGLEGAWYLATILDQLLTTKLHRKHKKKKVSYLIKYHTLFFKQHDDDDDLLLPLTDVVDPSFIRPSPPPNEDNNNISKEFEVGDVVDAYHRDGWWIGVVKTVIINQPQLNNYIVSFEDQDLMFEKSNLRFHVDWVDSRWIIPPKQTPKQLATGDGIATDNNVLSVAQMTEEALLPSSSAKIKAVSRKRSKSDSAAKTSRAKRIQPSPGGKENTKVTVSVMEASRSDDIHQSSPPETIITQTCELKDGMGHRNRKKGRPPKLVVEKPVGLLQGSSCLCPPDHHGNSLSQASAGTTSDYQQGWPFIKRFPIWDTIELYSQKPHFSPLKTRKEEFREGLAIGYMVTFWNLAQRLSDLQLNDPADELNNILETLCDLEIHGFDVGPIRSRLNDLLTLKSKVSQHEDTRKEVEKELQKCKHEKSQMEKEIDQYKTEMRVLKLKTKRAVNMWKRKEGEVTRLRSKRILICNQISDWKLAFGKLAATDL